MHHLAHARTRSHLQHPPGTTMNHADKTREPSVKYVHDERDVYELWTIKDIKVRSTADYSSNPISRVILRAEVN